MTKRPSIVPHTDFWGAIIIFDGNQSKKAFKRGMNHRFS